MGTDEEQPAATEPEQQEQAEVKTTGKRKIFLIVLTLILILAVGLTLGLVLRDKDGNKQDSSALEQGGGDSSTDSSDSGSGNNDPAEDEEPVNDVTPAPSATWPHQESDIAKDPDLRVGQLENGLRYMILPHPWPEGKVSFRLHIDAGSLMEDDDQLGYVCWR